MHLVVQETAPLEANNIPVQGDLSCLFEQFQSHRSRGSEIRLAALRNQSSGHGDAEQASDVCDLFHRVEDGQPAFNGQALLFQRWRASQLRYLAPRAFAAFRRSAGFTQSIAP